MDAGEVLSIATVVFVGQTVVARRRTDGVGESEATAIRALDVPAEGTVVLDLTRGDA